MKKDVIITIGRQYGSAGHEIGAQLAEKLGVPFYDKEIIHLAAERSGMDKELISSIDEKISGSFLYSIATHSISYASPSASPINMPLNDKLFFIQSNIIRELADKGSCVIVGRCADYILKDRTNCLNVFLYAKLEARILRIMNKYQVSRKIALETINKNDKRRKNYYNHTTGNHWSEIENYHLAVDTGLLGIEKTVELLVNYAKTFSE